MRITALMILSCLIGTQAAHARIKLVALPERARVAVSMNNPNATLVEEERMITLQKGVNNIDFSWRGVNVDASSIQVRAVNAASDIDILSTSYPPNEAALIWAISSPTAREERVRISYLLQGLTRELVYKAVAEPDEKTINLRNYLRVRNNSGEDLTGAEMSIGYGLPLTRAIAHEEVLEMQLEKLDAVPMKKILRWDSAALPWDPEYQQNTVGIPLSYVITNNRASKLGAHTLLPGKARIFLKTREQTAAGQPPREGVAFTGEDWAALTPVDRDLRLQIGESREVKVTQRQTRKERTNIRRNNQNHDVVWDTDEEFRIEIENFKKTPTDLVVVEHIPGFWKLAQSSHRFDKKDAFTIEYPLTLAPNTTGTNKTVITLRLNRLNVQGDNEPKTY